MKVSITKSPGPIYDVREVAFCCDKARSSLPVLVMNLPNGEFDTFPAEGDLCPFCSARVEVNVYDLKS